MTKPFKEIKNDRVRYNLHKGQKQVMQSDKRFIFALAGTQSGKTILGPLWLYREMKEMGSGDYMAVSPSFPLQKKKLLPEYQDFFIHDLGIGKYYKSDQIMTVTDGDIECKIFFGSADRPESLESCTAKAAHLDEVGQKTFRLDSWLAVLRRLSINQGRVYAGTTLYNLGWLKHEIYDPWLSGNSDITVIQFSSIMNPAFPKAEYERARNTLPLWKFRMFYQGQYDRPAGMIYDCFEDEQIIEPFDIPKSWDRFTGHDFGGTNMAALWIAEEIINEEVSNFYIYRDYLEGGEATEGHAKNFKQKSLRENIVKRVGGAPSEDQYRRDFTVAGWPIVRPPISDVEAGISRVYGLHKKNRIYVFNTCRRYIEEKTSYSRVLDSQTQEPTEKIEDKNKYHLMDGERYVISYLTSRRKPVPSTQPHEVGVVLP